MPVPVVNICHYGDSLLPSRPTIYLFGPTHFPDQPLAEHWHNQAIRLFESREFTCNLCLPAPRDGIWRQQDAAGQTYWQFRCQEQADAAVFWVPRFANMTSTEFGAQCERHQATGRPVVLGLPSGLPGTDCFANYAAYYSIPRYHTLAPALDHIAQIFG